MAGDRVDRRAGRAARGPAWWSRTAPIVAPGSVVAPANGAAGSPRRSAIPRAQPPVRASSRPVVEAAVASLRSSPVSQREIRSGTSAMCSAAASAPDRSSASSWKTVLIGIVWMPVTPYRSAAGTRSWARATIPSVRPSR